METLVEQGIFGLLALVAGASVGSFVNVVADRLPAGGSLVTPRSFCDACKRPLASLDMVPVISYLWLRGKCRHCGAEIPARVMLVELTNGVLFALIYARYGFGAEFIVLGVAVSLLLAVAIIDLEHHLILNRIVFPGMAVLVLLAPFWTELGLSRPLLGSYSMIASFGSSLVAGAGFFLLFWSIIWVYFLLGRAKGGVYGMGEGDVKLAGLIGLLVGYPNVLVALWISVVSAGVVVGVLWALRRKTLTDGIPYGPFMSLGTVVALLAGSEIISWYVDLSASIGGSAS